MAFDFEFSVEQEALRASVRRFLTERAPTTYVREQWGDPVGTTDDAWQGLADLGATGLLVPEELGGTDAGMVTAGVVLEELGRAVHPGPFASTAVSVPTLLRGIEPDGPGHSAATELLAGIADGSRRAAVVEGRPARIGASADGRLTGSQAWVRDAAAADTLVVVAEVTTLDPIVHLVDTREDAVRIEPIDTVDGSTSFATVVLDGARGVPVGADEVTSGVERARAVAGIAGVTQGVGTAAQALDIAVEYAKQRHQFGQPIGSFQAVQHLCTDMLIDLELGRAGAYYALWAADEAPLEELRRAATMAQAWASDAFERVGASAIQVLGGIGYTWEHDIHLFYKRLLTLQHDGGGTTSHLDALAARLLD